MSCHGKPALLGGLLCLLVLAVSAQDCDKNQCKGPVRFYEELKCKPNYAKEGDCCALSYDCSHLQGRSMDKCYANGREYNIGEKMKDEDRANPCDIACTCIKGFKDLPMFACATVDCFNMRVKEGCYFKRDLNSCCGGEEVCPKPDEKIVTCDVNGTSYKDGELFYPNNDQVCKCSKDYKGENIEPFCRNVTCGIELRRPMELHENCSPVFYADQLPASSCSYAYRCQNDNDTVIPSARAADAKSDVNVSDDMKCKFGNMTMNIGDELNQGTDYSSVCIKCVCEVPPMPTCQQLPEKECDMTKHADFSS